jgi:hypothetical protein
MAQASILKKTTAYTEANSQKANTREKALWNMKMTIDMKGLLKMEKNMEKESTLGKTGITMTAIG